MGTTVVSSPDAIVASSCCLSRARLMDSLRVRSVHHGIVVLLVERVLHVHDGRARRGTRGVVVGVLDDIHRDVKKRAPRVRNGGGEFDVVIGVSFCSPCCDECLGIAEPDNEMDEGVDGGAMELVEVLERNLQLAVVCGCICDSSAMLRAQEPSLNGLRTDSCPDVRPSEAEEVLRPAKVYVAVEFGDEDEDDIETSRVALCIAPAFVVDGPLALHVKVRLRAVQTNE